MLHEFIKSKWIQSFLFKFNKKFLNYFGLELKQLSTVREYSYDDVGEFLDKARNILLRELPDNKYDLHGEYSDIIELLDKLPKYRIEYIGLRARIEKIKDLLGAPSLQEKKLTPYESLILRNDCPKYSANIIPGKKTATEKETKDVNELMVSLGEAINEYCKYTRSVSDKQALENLFDKDITFDTDTENDIKNVRDRSYNNFKENGKSFKTKNLE